VIIPQRKALYITIGDLNYEKLIRFQTFASKCFENKSLDQNNMTAYSVLKVWDGIVVSKAPFPPEPKKLLAETFWQIKLLQFPFSSFLDAFVS
jgi:hypothetical protein